MIKKLILSKQSYFQLILVVFGSVFGLLMMLLSIQLYLDIKSVLDNKKEAIGSHFIVLSQPVSLLNTISGSANYFDEKEIQNIEKIKGVESVAKFNSSRFSAKAGFDFEGKSMYTDMFFESVPNDFLEIDSSEWHWKAGEILPIVLPSDYLNLYNFGFAPGQNLPQISRNTAKLAGLNVKISNRDSSLELIAGIAGFTDRINSILVPESFILYANEKYGAQANNGSSRIVVKSKDPSNPDLLKFIESNGYETNLELLKGGKMNALLNIVMGIVLSICLVVIILSVLSFIQYTQLLLNHSKYEIRTLLQIGFEVSTVFKYYFLFYVGVMLVVLICGLIGLYFISEIIQKFFVENGFNINNGIRIEAVLMSLVTVLFFIGLNAWNTMKTIRIYAKSDKS